MSVLRRNRHTIDDLIRDDRGGPLLTAEEEVALGRTIRSPDATAEEREEAIRSFMGANIRLVISEARKRLLPGEDLGDLVSDGTIGLGRAVRKWDPGRGVRFSTYATYWIRQAISRARLEHGHGRPWVIPVHLHAAHRKVEKYRRRMAAAGEPVSIEEAARRLGFGRYASHLPKVDAIVFQERRPLGTPGGADLIQEAGHPEPLARLAAAESGDPYGDGIETARVVRRYLGRLREAERTVLRYYYGFDYIPGTDADRPRYADKPGGLIAAHLGISRERVRQIRQAALAKIRRWAEEDGCS